MSKDLAPFSHYTRILKEALAKEEPNATLTKVDAAGLHAFLTQLSLEENPFLGMLDLVFERLPKRYIEGRLLPRTIEGIARAFDVLDEICRLADQGLYQLILCPRCHMQHIDEGWEGATKPHKIHSCQGCGLNWQPSLVPTIGVRFLPGCKNADSDRIDPEIARREIARMKDAGWISEEDAARLLGQIGHLEQSR